MNQSEILSRYIDVEANIPEELRPFINPTPDPLGVGSPRKPTPIDEYLNRQSPEKQRMDEILKRYR